MNVTTFAIIASVLMAILLFFVDFWWLVLAITLLVLVVCIMAFHTSKTICPICKVTYYKSANNSCPHCRGIDFASISSCKITEEIPTHKIESETNYYPGYEDTITPPSLKQRKSLFLTV